MPPSPMLSELLSELPSELPSGATMSGMDGCRWDRIREGLAGLPVTAERMLVLAERHGLAWPSSRSDDRLEAFLVKTWEQLRTTRGFGAKKTGQLLAIAEAVYATAVPEIARAESVSPPREEPLAADLPGWRTFPLELCGFSARAHTLFAFLDIRELGAFVDCLHEVGPLRLAACRGVGRQTMSEIETFYASWTAGDLAAASRYLPCGPGGGFSLAHACYLYLEAYDPFKVEALCGRLVQGRTLQSIAGPAHVCRERIRQIEKCFLDHLAKCCAFFGRESLNVFDLGSDSPVLSDDIPQRARQIIAGGIRKVLKPRFD